MKRIKIGIGFRRRVTLHKSRFFLLIDEATFRRHATEVNERCARASLTRLFVIGRLLLGSGTLATIIKVRCEPGYHRSTDVAPRVPLM